MNHKEVQSSSTKLNRSNTGIGGKKLAGALVWVQNFSLSRLNRYINLFIKRMVLLRAIRRTIMKHLEKSQVVRTLLMHIDRLKIMMYHVQLG